MITASWAHFTHRRTPVPDRMLKPSHSESAVIQIVMEYLRKAIQDILQHLDSVFASMQQGLNDTSTKVCTPAPKKVGRGPLTSEEIARRRSQKLCFYCGEPSHSISECLVRPPKLPRTFPGVSNETLQSPVLPGATPKSTPVKSKRTFSIKAREPFSTPPVFPMPSEALPTKFKKAVPVKSASTRPKREIVPTKSLSRKPTPAKTRTVYKKSMEAYSDKLQRCQPNRMVSLDTYPEVTDLEDPYPAETMEFESTLPSEYEPEIPMELAAAPPSQTPTTLNQHSRYLGVAVYAPATVFKSSVKPGPRNLEANSCLHDLEESLLLQSPAASILRRALGFKKVETPAPHSRKSGLVSGQPCQAYIGTTVSTPEGTITIEPLPPGFTYGSNGTVVRCADLQVFHNPKSAWRSLHNNAVPRSKSRAVPRSKSRAVPRSKSRAVPRSKSRAVPRSKSRAVPRSKSRAVPRSKSCAVPRSRSKSRAVPRSRSKSRAVPRSRSKSRAVPRSKSRAVPRSKSRAVPRSRSKSRAVPRSRFKSRAVPRSGSKSRAVPRSRSRSKSRAVPRSRSKSRAVPRSRSKSRAVPRSRSKSRAVPRSRSKSRACTEVQVQEPCCTEVQVQEPCCTEVQVQEPCCTEVRVQEPCCTEVQVQEPCCTEVQVQEPCCTEVQVQEPCCTEVQVQEPCCTEVQVQEPCCTEVQVQEPCCTEVQVQEPCCTEVQVQEPCCTEVQVQEPCCTEVQVQEPCCTEVQVQEPCCTEVQIQEPCCTEVQAQTAATKTTFVDTDSAAATLPTPGKTSPSSEVLVLVSAMAAQVNTLTHTIQDMQLNHKYLQSQVQVALARGHFSTPDLVATSNPIHQDDSEPTVLDSTSDMDPTIPYSVQGIVIRRTDLENTVTILTTQTSSLEVTGPGPNRWRRRKK
uniref:Uncharacterized protein n=1 Tax=Leptobrachium leishanense TaxID=445787 RepID=A0A8C5WCK0_9ANUR